MENNIGKNLMGKMGITLVTVVITVIVIFIIAGVTIGLINGNIIQKAFTSAQKYNEANENELEKLDGTIGKKGEYIKTNIIDGKLYYPEVIVEFSNIGELKATLNGEEISNNMKVDQIGKYILKLENEYGTVVQKTFYINDGLVGMLMGVELEDGRQEIKVEDEVYSIEVINFNEDVTYTNNTTLGDLVADSSLLVLKYKGNLTIETGVELKPSVRKKAMVILVNGELINKGTISMTARGANAEGQNVYLWRNEDKGFEFVPKFGAKGSPGGTTGAVTAGQGRQTGGGSGGLVELSYGGRGGAGAAGTSYSGGSGGGGTSRSVAGAASPNGGAGGNGKRIYLSGYYYGAGGGAGNPGGIGEGGYGGGSKGEDGTGGLLIVYADKLNNISKMEARGSKGGAGYDPGGSSGGGSINIFYNKLINQGLFDVNGGAAASNSGGYGGRQGGKGTFTLTQI